MYSMLSLVLELMLAPDHRVRAEYREHNWKNFGEKSVE